MLCDDFDDASWYLCYWLQNEFQSNLLIVILKWEKRWLILQLNIIVLISVHFHSYEVESVKHLLRPEHSWLDMVDWHYNIDVLSCCDVREQVLKFGVFQSTCIHRVDNHIEFFERVLLLYYFTKNSLNLIDLIISVLS